MIQGLKYKRLIIIITHLHAYFIVSSLMNRPVQLRRNVLAWENARGLVKRRGTGRGEWRMKSIGNVEKLPSSISFPLSFSTTYFLLLLLANILSLSFPSFFPSFLFFHLLLLRDLELETTILPAGRFHLIREECSRRSFAEREKKEKKKRRRKRETLESSRPLDVYLETGHNYVANRVNEFFPACRISRATRVKSRRRVVRISRLSEFISGNKRPEIKFRFQEFARILRYAYSSFSMRVQQSFFPFFPVLFGCN